MFFIADLHLLHEKILTFKRNDGTPLRDFNSIAEHDGTLIHNWNKVVNINDRVYVAGDVAWGLEGLQILKAMNGRKTLIKGNHDNLINVRKYLGVFDDVHGVKVINTKGHKFVVSHVPLHPDSLEHWGVNIHGHVHSNTLDDDRYFNVSCEAINYTPIHIDEIIELTKGN